MSATQPRLCSPLSLAFAWLPSADVHGRGRPPLHLSSATPLLFHKKKTFRRGVRCALPLGHPPPMSATQPRLSSPASLAFGWLLSAGVRGRGRPPLRLSSTPHLCPTAERV